MILNFLWPLLGLFAVVVAHGSVRHHTKAEGEETSPGPATTEAPQVSVSSVLANYDGLNLIYNEEERTIGFANVTENVGISFTDCKKSDIRIILDSKTGRALNFQTLDKVALIQNNEFRGDILKSLDLILQNFIYKKEPISGNSSELESSSEDALSLWTDVYLHLGHPREKGSTSFRSLKYLERFSRRLKHLYLGSLKGLITGKSPFPLKQNLNRFLTISLGLHELFGKAKGGLKAILAKNVTFEVNSLFNGKNGAEVLVYIMRQTGAKFDLTTLWSDLLNNIEDLLDIISKLGGGETKNGVDETFAIIGHFWAAVRLKIPVTNFIHFLFESASEDHWSQADDGDFKQVLKDAKNVTDEQSKKFDNLIKLSGFVKFFTNLTANSLIENNVNISELVEKWRKRDAVGGLRLISHLTLKLFSPEKYSNLLFDSFTAFLNATSDKESLKHLIPGVPLEEFGSGESAWSSICKSGNIDEQLKKGANATQLLNGVPVFSEFSKIFQESFGKSFDFSKVLNGGTLTDYLSKNPFSSLFKPGKDGFSKFFHDGFSKYFKESSDALKHIFVDPIQHFLPIPLLPKGSDIPNLPFLGPGPVVIASTEKSSDDKESKATIDVEGEDDVEEKETTSKKSCDDCEEKKTESTNKEKSTTSSSEPGSTEKPTTPASEETHLTGSVSTTPCDDESKTEKNKEETEKTTKKKCDDCDEKESKSTTIVVETEEGSSPATTEASIEDRHHHRHHAEHRHHVHHSSRGNHKERNHDKDQLVHKYKHHHHTNGHENKHHARTHQDKHHHEKTHHAGRKHNHETHQDKHHVKKHLDHEAKHHQRVQRSERHLARHHHNEEKNQR